MSWPPCFRSARPVASRQSTVAQDFTDHLNRVLNRTLTHSRLAVVDIPSETDLFLIRRMEAGKSMALELPGSDLTLFVQQLVRVVDDGAGNTRLNTISYQYRLQTEGEGQSLIRWEYNRKPAPADYGYPPAHVHFHGLLNGEDTTRLHVPTGRMPLELVVWHLISDWQVPPLVDQWQSILEESIEGFAERFSAYP